MGFEAQSALEIIRPEEPEQALSWHTLILVSPFLLSSASHSPFYHLGKVLHPFPRREANCSMCPRVPHSGGKSRKAGLQHQPALARWSTGDARGQLGAVHTSGRSLGGSRAEALG